jgi:DNA-binding CsgD family transcriptional regulator
VLAEIDALQIGPTLNHLDEALRLQREAGATDGELARFLAWVVTGLHDAGAPRELWTPRLHEALSMVDRDDRLTWARLALLDEQFETIAVDGIAGSRWRGVDSAATQIARASGDEELFARSLQPWDLWNRARTEELTDLIDTWQQPTAIVRALMVSGADWLYHHGDFRTARVHFEKLRSVARQQGSIQGQGDAWVRLAVIHAALGDVTMARQCEREATVFIERLGQGHHLHASLWWARAYLCELERLPFDSVAEFFRAYIGDPDVRKRTIPCDDAALATLALLRIGQVSAATHLLQSLVKLLERTEPDTWLLNGAVGFAGTTVWELGLAGPAPTILQATRAAMNAGHGDYPGCSNHLTVARMHALLDQPDIARRWFMLAREHLDQSGQRVIRLRVDLDEATALARGSAVSWSLATTLARRAGQGYRDLGLNAWAERAERLATEVEGRPQQEVPMPGGISGRERNVVELVAQGLSDREIAAAMFLSPRTVNAHLRNIYAKTGARNRTDLTRWAVREGLIPARDAS